MLQSFLQKIGLSDKESIIYLTSLRFGSQPVSVIAKHSEINRTTVYDLFESLIKKGLATKICKGTTTYFQVSDPKNLINYLEREQNEYIRKTEKQINEVKNILPALKSLENPQSTKPKVQFFDGEKGMREAYEDTLTSTESIRADANIFIRSISPDNKLSLERHKYDKTENREMKFIPAQKYNFSPELNVYDDKIMIASWQEKMAIIIKSKEIADLHKMIYDLLWDKL